LGSPVLGVTDLTVSDDDGLVRVDAVSLQVRSGEILGVAAVAGNGQHELVEAICGLRPRDGGSIVVGGKEVAAAEMALTRESGLAYIPEDRHRVGTAAGGEVWANLVMGFQRLKDFRRGRFMRRAEVDEHARRIIADYDVRVAGPAVAAATLSGGNLQKLVVGREMSHAAPLLVAEEPTRGVDVGAIEFLHRQLIEYRNQGGGILLLSAELWELLALSSRIVVMYEGRIVAELDPAETDEAELGFFMTGGRR
jgi:simple sugar transport system ATP-binding protein